MSTSLIDYSLYVKYLNYINDLCATTPHLYLVKLKCEFFQS